MHISVDQDPTPLLNIEEPTRILFGRDRVPLDVFLLRDRNVSVRDNSVVQERTNFRSDDLELSVLSVASRVLLSETNAQEELCEIWTGLCPLVSH